MRTSVERWRLGLLAGAGLLVVVIAAFLGYAKYRVGKVISDLPGKLGATITRESNGYTYSQSDGKRTVFTIHAAKAMQHADGKFTLHDVSMILYGHSGDRADRISGETFEYDTKAEVVKAIGVVHLDLGASIAGAPDNESRKHVEDGADAAREGQETETHVIHVKTSGLVYTKQSGTATTDQGLEFAFGGYTGHAVGAEYNSNTGHVVLQSAIALSGMDKGRPIALNAAHGELDRTVRLAQFQEARYSTAGEVGRARTAEVHLREDNSIERIVGIGQVVLEDGEQGRFTSDRAEISLDPANKPEAAVLTGAVRFYQDGPFRQAQSAAEKANLGFDGKGHVDHALLRGQVMAAEHRQVANDAKSASDRTLTSHALEIWLAADGGQTRPLVRDIVATGSVRMTTSDAPGATRAFAGDELTAHMVLVNGSPELSTAHGTGHTMVEQTSADGVFQKSTGDTLDAKFLPARAKGKGSVELASVVQQGGVAIERRVPGKGTGAATDVQRATARKAVFDADSDTLTLTGEVAMNDAGRQVLAARVEIAQKTGDAMADGGVRVTYQQTSSAEPTHVLATRAQLNRGLDKAIFHGGGNGMARLWQAGTGGQGGSQIEAPVLVFEGTNGQQKNSRLTARAETPGTPAQVHAVLAENRSRKTAGGSPPEGQHAKPQAVARIVSSEMVYSAAERKAEFHGGVRLTDGTGEMKAQDAVVFLAARESAAERTTSKESPATVKESSATANASNVNGLLGGSVERIIATEHIVITQPGRKATGERLVYTAGDQMFVLTGTAATPPKVVDSQQGSTTGAALQFHSGDNNVVVSGADGITPARKVETETRVKR